MAKRLLKLVELPKLTKREFELLLWGLRALELDAISRLADGMKNGIGGQYRRHNSRNLKDSEALSEKLEKEVKDAGKQTGPGVGTDSGPSGDHGRRREKLPGALGRIYAGPR